MASDGTAEGSPVVDIARWAAGLDLGRVPTDVVDLCRAQRRSVLAGVAASARDAATVRVLAGIVGTELDSALPLARVRDMSSDDDALYVALAMSIALDFDDYMCFAHAGHSSVLVPLLVGRRLKASGTEQLVAQIIANEVAARLGGACLIGPLNGQMWSFVHAAGAALATARMMGLDEGRTANALAIAIYQAPRPTPAGFMGPDSKLLTAAEPALIGVRSARLAAGGVSGPLDVLDDRRGFLGAFSYAPIRSLFDGLGEGWATRTLCVKPYPGCAYIDTAVDALLALPRVDPDEIRSIEVDAGLLTCAMDALAAPVKGFPTPVWINFSIPYNVALVALAGKLTPEELESDFLSANEDAIGRLVQKVTLRHDWDLTRASQVSFAGVLPPGALRRELGSRRLLRGLRRARRDHPRVVMGGGDVLGALRTLAEAGRGREPGRFWDEAALRRFRMTFPARVTVNLKDGSVLTEERHVPRGGCGSSDLDPASAAGEKLSSWGPRLWGREGTNEIEAAIAGDADELADLL